MRSLIALLLAASPALATQNIWPALYDVAGVRSDDVLNVRAAPDPKSEIIGALNHDATGIEVIRTNPHESWGLVNTNESAGWVALRYLARHHNQFMGEFPAIRKCFGTEPFWALSFGDASTRFVTPINAAEGRVVEKWTSQNRRDSHAISIRLDDASDAEADIVGVLRHDYCSDGMSDREYGIRLDMLFRGTIDSEFMSGCCSIQPPEE